MTRRDVPRVPVHADGGPCHGTMLVNGRCPGCGVAPDMQSVELWLVSVASPAFPKTGRGVRDFGTGRPEPPCCKPVRGWWCVLAPGHPGECMPGGPR